jgi:hypothetical protein
VFPFTFKVFAAGDLDVVKLTAATGIEATLVLSSDYTVTLNDNQNTNPGGSVTLTAGALATGFTLTITSDIANLQPTDLTNQGGFYPEVITDALDRATIQIQQISDIGDRTLKIPITDGSLNMELPTATTRANAFLAFDSAGLPIVQAASSSAAPTSITRQVFSGTGSQTAFVLASNPGGAGNSACVYIGGIYQQRNTYVIAGTTLTFNEAPVAGTNNIEFVNFLIGSGSNGVGIVTLTGHVTGSGTGTVPATIAAGVVTPAMLTTGGPSWSAGGDLTVTGDIIVTGNDIKSSAATAMTLSGADVTMQGNTTFKNVTDGVVAIGTVGASHTFSLAAGTLQTATLTSATAATFTMPTATAGKRFTLLLRQPSSGTATTATFTGVKWSSGTAPTITATLGRLDIFNFYADGTNWYGTFVQNYTP